MKNVIVFLKAYKKEVILGPLFKLTEAIFELIVPLVMIRIVDVGIKNGDMAYVWQMGLIMLLLGVVGLGCSLTCQYFAAKASQGFGTDVRNALFRHINSLSHSEIDKIGTPSLITRINNDVNQLQLGVAMLIRLVIRSPFLVIGAIIMAMLIDIKMSLVFVAAAPLIALVLYFVMSRSVPFFKKIQKGLDKVSLITRENLSGARVIRAFSTQKKEQERFFEASNELTNSALSVGRLSAMLNPLTTVIVNFAIIAIIIYGGMRVNIGTLTQGEIIAFVNYLTQILVALIAVANLVVIFTKAFASAGRVGEIFRLSPSIADGDKTVHSRKADSPLLELEQVSLSYNMGGEAALSCISFCVDEGETIGIIGGTGSGKTSLINLLPRFYDATSGSVRVGGVDVREYSTSELRSMFGIVPQKSLLFAGTIKENMLWGNETATDEDILQALDIAQALEFVQAREGGIDSEILQGGKNLSGGQEQRLAIARAIVRRPKILILDDSASALDFATDARLRSAIKELKPTTTVFIVSQRVNSVKNSDRILCLDDGMVVGMGTHQELYSSCEQYREICLTQLSESEVSAE